MKEGKERKKLVRLQFDCSGNFRIASNGKVGEPAFYEGVATLEVEGQTYVAFTQYYEGTVPETEKVFKLTPTDTTVEDTPVCNLFRPEESCIHEKNG